MESICQIARVNTTYYGKHSTRFHSWFKIKNNVDLASLVKTGIFFVSLV